MPRPKPPLISKLATAWPLERWKDVTVLVAVSGGADSVALLRGLAQLRAAGRSRLLVGHFNHRLRGAESDADQAFVANLSREMYLEVIVGRADDDLAVRRGGEGLEGAARVARYEFFTSAAHQCGARYIATAHTADDQVETILHNMLRGTGLAGLGGIPRLRRLSDAATIVRPLLDVTRAEVLKYLDAIGQHFCDDSTNRLEDYTRNRIRVQLLPLLEEKFNPHVRESLLRLGRIAGQADEFLDREAERLLTAAIHPFPGGMAIEVAPLASAPDIVARQALMVLWKRSGWPQQDMSATKWDQLVGLCRAADADGELVAAQFYPGNIRAERRRGMLWLTPADS